MTETEQWLRSRSEDQFVALLQTRPDLIVPLPTDLAVLARRLDSPHSVWRVLESCNAFQVQILIAMLLLRDRRHATTARAVAELVGRPEPLVAAALEDLQVPGLVRAEPAATAGTDSHATATKSRSRKPRAVGWRVCPALPGTFGSYPGGVGPSGRLTDPQAAEAVAGLTAAERRMLEALAEGWPVGQVSPGSRTVADRLIDLGLLRPVEGGQVLLTREARLAVRGRLLEPVAMELPAVDPVVPQHAAIDQAAADRALAAVALARRVQAEVRDRPLPQLKTGGLGIKEIRRLGKSLGLPEAETALLVELLAAIGALVPRSSGNDRFWAAGPDLPADHEKVWSLLVRCWLDLAFDPARAGTKDGSGRLRAGLSGDVSWPRGPVDRRFVLGTLADLPAGTTVRREDLLARMSWLSPLRNPELLAQATARIGDEATFLGLIAFDVSTATLRGLLAGTDPADLLREALPAPVDSFVIQADLTVLVPGRPAPELENRLTRLAEVESTGGAVVFRISERSLRRGFDDGEDAGALKAFFRDHSVTGVPQALDYLIDDVARRHGTLRIGPAGAYLRADDRAVLDAAVAHARAAGVLLRRLAPTVAVTAADPAKLLAALNIDGLLPVIEDAQGLVVSSVPRPDEGDDWDALARPFSAPARPGPTPEQLRTLVRRLTLPTSTERTHGTEELVTLIEAAIAGKQTLWIGYVEADGRAQTRLIDPIALSGGALAAHDRLRGTQRILALHRVTSASISAEE